MALYQPPATAKDEKLIVGGVPVPGSVPAPVPRAAQFVQHEADGGLRRRDLHPDGPIAQFHDWFARAAGLPAIPHPEACTLSTASLPSGRVSARMVYLKELDRRGGFVVYSNFGTSRKAADLFGGGEDGGVPNPWVALTFFWEPQERQVRVEGRAARLSPEASQAYYDTRVRGSRIGAWASRQSAVLQPSGEGEDDGRAQLEKWVAETEEKFGRVDDPNADDAPADHIPVPPFWGGLRIVPERIEFWQGRANRLHDRFAFDRVHGAGEAAAAAEGPVDVEADVSAAEWTVSRLSP